MPLLAEAAMLLPMPDFVQRKKNQHDLVNWIFVVNSIRSDLASRNIVVFPAGGRYITWKEVYVQSPLQEKYLFPPSESGGQSGLHDILRDKPDGGGEQESAWDVLQKMGHEEQRSILLSRVSREHRQSAAVPSAVPSPSIDRQLPQSKRHRK